MDKLVRLFQFMFALIFGLLVLLIYFYFPYIRANLQYRTGRRDNVTVVKKGSFVAGMRNIMVANDNEFGLVVPKIGINTSVIVNVDPFDPVHSLEALSRGVAHSRGSSLPGKGGNIILFSNIYGNILEVQKYNTDFYMMNQLAVGDPIIVYYKAVQHRYAVTGSTVVDEMDLNFSDIAINPKTELLSIMTLWPPGISLRRLVVEAKKI